jgi:hypothetical protein
MHMHTHTHTHSLSLSLFASLFYSSVCSLYMFIFPYFLNSRVQPYIFSGNAIFIAYPIDVVQQSRKERKNKKENKIKVDTDRWKEGKENVKKEIVILKQI